MVMEKSRNVPSIVDALRRHHHQVQLLYTNNLSGCRARERKHDVVLLYSDQPGNQRRELFDEITGDDPSVPIIVITGPATSAERARDHYRRGNGLSPSRNQTALVLQKVREVLREPKIKRLVRVTESSGKTSFLARNARWLSENLQARYSTPFAWSLPAAFRPPEHHHSENPV